MKTLDVTEFVNTEHKSFSVANSIRSIPLLIDGLKTSQRKALYGAFKYGKLEIVDRLALQTAAITSYSHAGDNMSATIVNMARAFPGSNNIPYFDREGQFGNILDSESSDPRYIEAEVSKVIRQIFMKEDEGLLEHLYDRDDQIEPKFYLPVLPMILVNGALGIGTAYASSIPNHTVSSVIKALRDLLAGNEPTPLVAGWEGYRGRTGYQEDGRWFCEGIFQRVNTSVLRITSVPIGNFSQNYTTTVLLPLLKEKVIVDYSNNSTEDSWDIEITFKRGELQNISDKDIVNMFLLYKCTKPNFVAWGVNGKIRKYETPEEMLKEFFEYRVARYEDRRLNLIEVHRKEVAMMVVRREFMKYIMGVDLNQPLKALVAGFVELTGIKEEFVVDLFKASISSINQTAVENLNKKVGVTEREIKRLEKETAVSLYTDDINQLEAALNA